MLCNSGKIKICCNLANLSVIVSVSHDSHRSLPAAVGVEKIHCYTIRANAIKRFILRILFICFSQEMADGLINQLAVYWLELVSTSSSTCDDITSDHSLP